jgi:hypothetical protein
MKRPLAIAGLVLVLLVLFAGCAPGPNASVDRPDEEGEVAGFWRGIWHGLIAPVTFVISLFSDSVTIYEVHNSGGWYNFGFLFGMMIVFGGGGGGTACSRRR